MASCRLLLSGSWVGWLGDMRIRFLTALEKLRFKLVLFSCMFSLKFREWLKKVTWMAAHWNTYCQARLLELHLKLSWSSPVPTLQLVLPFFFCLISPQTFTSELTGFISRYWTVGKASWVPLIWPFSEVYFMMSWAYEEPTFPFIPEKKPGWLAQV